MLSKVQQDTLIELANHSANIKTKYVRGADPLNAPGECDCSSLIVYLYAQIGIELPRSSIYQAGDPNSKEVNINTATFDVGDLLFMRGVRGHYIDSMFPNREIYIGHVGMFVKDNKIIHAKKDNGVIIQNISDIESDPKYKIILAKRY